MNLQLLTTELEHLNTQIASLKKEIASLPSGNLVCLKNGKYIKWFQSNGTKPIYIRKQEHVFAEQLAIKKYYMSQLTQLIQEKELLKHLLSNLKEISSQTENLLDESSCYKDLILKHLQSFSEDTTQWLQEDFNANPNYPEKQIHKTLAGHCVRSKSEVLIANALFLNQIPYRYECELFLDSMTFYPDFTILHPYTHKIFYWEHFGMMDNASYREKTYAKLNTYGAHQIYPSINLITTYETLNHPVDSNKIQAEIQNYFL